MDETAKRLSRRVRLMETARLMYSEDWKDRLRAEYQQLMIRIEGLNDAISRYKAEQTPLQVDLNTQQLKAMVEYRNVLELRAKLENIRLS